jgi:fatty acid desaturase
MSMSFDRAGYKKMPWAFNVLIGIDQLGNAIADGNPDNTVSSRVGYFASSEHDTHIKLYWKALEWTINLTFTPIQGPGHCYRAWKAEGYDTDSKSTYIFRIILGLFAIAACVIIAPILWIAVFIVPAWRFKPKDRQYDDWREERRDDEIRRAALRANE